MTTAPHSVTIMPLVFQVSLIFPLPPPLSLLFSPSIPSSCPFPLSPLSPLSAGSLAHYVVVPSMGLFSFLALGTSKHTFYFWKVFISLFVQRKFAELRELLTNEKALRKKMSSGSSNEVLKEGEGKREEKKNKKKQRRGKEVSILSYF